MRARISDGRAPCCPSAPRAHVVHVSEQGQDGPASRTPTLDGLAPEPPRRTLVAFVGAAGESWEAVRHALAAVGDVAGVDRVASAHAMHEAVLAGRYGAVIASLDDRSAEGWGFVKSHDGVLPVLCVTPLTEASTIAALRREVASHGVHDLMPLPELSGAVAELMLRHAVSHHELQRDHAMLRRRFELTVRGARDGVWEWNLETGEAWFSPRWKGILGYAPTELSPAVDEWFNRVHPHDLTRLRDELERARNEPGRLHELEHRLLGRDGAYHWVISRGATLHDGGGRPVRMAGSLTDSGSLRERVAELHEASRFDAVTNLPRQDVFMERLAGTIDAAREQGGTPFAVLIVEVDRFRAVTEGIGQGTADELLAQLANRLQGCVEENDVVARLEGARFGVILTGLTDTGEGTRVAERVHRVVERPFDAGGEPIYLNVNIGITSSEREYASPEAAIADASAAAARVGREQRPRRRPQMFATHMRIEAVEVLRLETSLRQAIERDEFILHYQPIVRLDDLSLLGFEALVRWQHPTRGIVPPGEFIPVAEKTGMIVPIGRWVMQAAAKQLRTWRDQYPHRTIGVSVNISGKQIGDPQLLADLLGAVQSSGVPANGLRVELTETELMQNAAEVQELLVGLRRNGMAVYLDDFGTGYSSLSYLDRFPVDGLKIDRSFVMVLDGTPDSATMVNTIMGLAGNLGLSVVAEGIENHSQLDQLRALGCTAGQGFLLSRPVDAVRATEFVGRGTLAG